MGNGHFYTPSRSVKYQELVRKVAKLSGCPVFADGVEVTLAIYLPDGRVRDRDNIEKGIMDALQHRPATKTQRERLPVAWMNDHDVGPMSRTWAIDRANPRVEVRLCGLRLPQVLVDVWLEQKRKLRVRRPGGRYRRLLKLAQASTRAYR